METPVVAPSSGRGVAGRMSGAVAFVLILIVRLYRVTLSPAQRFLFGPLSGCRFTPTCSQYAIESLQTHGPIRGLWMAAKRVCRCHPWGDCGHDPVLKKTAGESRKAQRQAATAHCC